MRDKTNENEFVGLADVYGLDVATVRAVVASFFDAVALQARKLPFDNHRAIFSKDKFEEYVRVWNIPYIGRLGPVYSRYLQWRVNEARDIDTSMRSDYKTIYTQEQIEDLAKKVLCEWEEGDAKIEMPKNKQTYPFKRVWIISKKGKKQARQVIPNKDV